MGIKLSPLAASPDNPKVEPLEAGYLPANHDWNFPSVLSPFWRLYYNRRTGHKLVFPDREIFLQPERLILIPDHNLFHTVGTKPTPHFWLHFNCGRRPVPGQAVPIELKVLPSELAVINEIERLLGRPVRLGNRARILGCSLALLHLVLSRKEIIWLEPKPAVLFRAIEHIERNYAVKLYTAELGRLIGMSESAFRRLFRQHHGATPMYFLSQVRVRAAAQMLAQTALGIDEIAERTGFPNRSYFTRIFTRQTGLPPAQFRRQNQGGSSD